MTRTAIKGLKKIINGEHLIDKFVGDESGRNLIVVGGVHGNEPAGVIAMLNVSKKLKLLSGELFCGRVYFIAGNTRALGRGVRFIDSDLNRHWLTGNLRKNKLEQGVPSSICEDKEQHELLQILTGILETAKDEVFVLDLHSTSAPGRPFATVGDTMRNRRFAQKFPVTILLGIEEQLDGTMLEYLNNSGAVTLGFEGGQHDSPETVKNHEALIWLALVNSEILKAEGVADLMFHKNKLLNMTGGKPEIVEVRYRQAIAAGDEFQMNPGFKNFDHVRRGQILARSRQGFIKAVETGLILMPLYQKQGEDGFFTGRVVAPVWLWLSKILRKFKIGNLIEYLPGVRPYPFDTNSFIVNTRVARFFPLQIFHLLGFRRRRWLENKLVVSRRRHDTRSPFKKRRR